MKFKFLKIAVTSFVISVCSFANAALIAVDDWHYTEDDLGGLRQSLSSPDVYYALTTLGIFDTNTEYEMIEGFHFATRAEHASLLGSLLGTTQAEYVHPYFRKGGFSGYPSYLNDPGSTRFKFIFADATTVGGYVHAGSYETNVQNGVFSHGSMNIAGLVLIRNPVVDEIPEPSTLAIFGLALMGLASRKFKKS